jgi:N-acyl-D-amino-acid deacylase
MAELLVRGGTVIDGTGAPGVVADVRVRDGRISEIGRDLRAHGEDVIDASGALVTPGFIDSHTHYDPSLFWDAFGDPMPLHGVTTLLVGSCSLSLAPVHGDQRALLTEVFCYIEDLPTATFDAAIPWTWEGYADYLAALGGDGLGLNVVTLVGHTALRMYVLGDEAWDRPSSPSERSEIASLLDGCLAAGAFGMSTSLGFDVHPTRGPVPSRVADDDELGLLIDCLAERSRLLQFIPSPGTGRCGATSSASLISPVPAGLSARGSTSSTTQRTRAWRSSFSTSPARSRPKACTPTHRSHHARST